MSVAIIASATTPVIAIGKLHCRPLPGFALSVAVSNLLTHALPYLAHPLDHYGPAYAIAIAMYLIITVIISAFVIISAIVIGLITVGEQAD